MLTSMTTKKSKKNSDTDKATEDSAARAAVGARAPQMHRIPTCVLGIYSLDSVLRCFTIKFLLDPCYEILAYRR